MADTTKTLPTGSRDDLLTQTIESKALASGEVNKIEEDEKRKARQNMLIDKLKTSSTQYKYLTSKFNEEKLSRLIQSLEAFKYGYNASAPLICLGPEKCPFFHACPIGNGIKVNNMNKKIPLYDDINDFPIGDQCIMEKVFIEQKLIDYIQEFDIDPNKASEVGLVNDLALIDLHKNRCVLFMAAGDKEGEGVDFMKVDITFGQVAGLEAKAYKEHPVIGIIEKLEKRRHKILEELIGTRKSKAAIMAKFHTANESSKLLDELERVRRAIETKTPQTIDISAEDIIEID